MTNDTKENMEASTGYKGGNCTSLERRITEVFWSLSSVLPTDSLTL